MIVCTFLAEVTFAHKAISANHRMALHQCHVVSLSTPCMVARRLSSLANRRRPTLLAGGRRPSPRCPDRGAQSAVPRPRCPVRGALVRPAPPTCSAVHHLVAACPLGARSALPAAAHTPSASPTQTATAVLEDVLRRVEARCRVARRPSVAAVAPIRTTEPRAPSLLSDPGGEGRAQPQAAQPEASCPGSPAAAAPASAPGFV